MANPKPNTTHLKRYPKGVSGNPNGRPKIPEDLKKARKLNQIEVGRIINRFMNQSVEFIKNEMEDENTSALEAMIGKIIIEAHKHGDYSRVNFLFDRMIGKVTEKVEHTMPKPTVIKLIGEDAAVILGSSKGDEDENNS
jgi:hypothetical protein